MEALQACAASEGGKQTIANAVAISSGGAPIFLVAEEEVFVFQGKRLIGRGSMLFVAECFD